jgi:hypothetical protein
MNFTADHVWALAVMADRINGGYFKQDKGHLDDDERWVLEKTANKSLVKQWLREGGVEPTEEDIQLGKECRAYFKTFVMRELSGKITDFERQALKISSKDYFGGRDLLEFAIISCLPTAMLRDRASQNIAREVYSSTQLVGNVGDAVRGEVEVIRCNYSQNYNKYRVNARFGDSFVDFWFAKECQVGDRFTIKGKIKTVRGDKTTQLNFVKRG